MILSEISPVLVKTFFVSVLRVQLIYLNFTK